MGGTSTGGRPPRTARVRQAHQGPVTERDGATVAFEAVHAIGLYGRRFRGGHVPGTDDGEVRQSKVATSVSSSRSATAMDASTAPSGRSASVRTSSGMRARSVAVVARCSDSVCRDRVKEGPASMSGRSSASQHASTTTVGDRQRASRRFQQGRAGQRAWCLSERSRAATSGHVNYEILASCKPLPEANPASIS